MPETPSATQNPLAGIVLPNEIDSINCALMPNGSHFLYMKNVNDRLKTETALLANPKIKKAAELLAVAVQKEDDYFARSQKNLITDDIRKADEERRRMVNAMRRTLKGFVDHPEAEKARAAETILKVMVAYRLNTRMQLERETGSIISFIGDCEKIYAADLLALGLKPYVDTLKTANEKIERWITQRSDSMPETLGTLRTARREADAAYQWLVKIVNACAMVDDSLDTAPFISHMNKVVRRYKQQVIGSRKKKDAEDPSKSKDSKQSKQPKDPKKKKDDSPDIHLPEEDDKKPEGGGTGKKPEDGKKPETPGGDDAPEIHMPEE